MLSTFIKLPFVIRSLFCLFLSGRFTAIAALERTAANKYILLAKYAYVKT